MQPYNRQLKERSQELRCEQTKAEKHFWYQILRDSSLAKYRWRRQKPLLGFIVDFYCSELLLVVEIDGGVHDMQQEYDEQRTSLLQNKLNVTVIRFTNNKVLNHPHLIIRALREFALRFQKNPLFERGARSLRSKNEGESHL